MIYVVRKRFLGILDSSHDMRYQKCLIIARVRFITKRVSLRLLIGPFAKTYTELHHLGLADQNISSKNIHSVAYLQIVCAYNQSCKLYYGILSENL